jgi:CspA family cold shock protein
MARISSGDTLRGTVKTVHADKGFGFISVDGSADEYFFHFTGLVGLRMEDLTRGTRVSFIAGSSTKGPRAEHVERA